MSLLSIFIPIISNWRRTFCKKTAFINCLCHTFCDLHIMHRKTLTAFIRLLGLESQDFSKHYKLYSRSRWNHHDLFLPIIEKAGALGNKSYIQLAADYTSIKKTGKQIPDTALIRDPMSPRFRHNLIWGLSFLHIAITLPCYDFCKTAARALPIRWQKMPKMKKPLKNSPEEEWEKYRRFLKDNNRSKIFMKAMQEVRNAVDRAGHKDKKLLVALDGDFCNRHVLTKECERIEFIIRTRKSSKLCFREKQPGRRFYSKEKFTPEEIRQNETIGWRTVRIYHGGEFREVHYKEVKEVYWQGGAKRRELRLIVIRPIPYRTTKKGKILYRQPAYLLCTDLKIETEKVLQAYFDRWEIEVNHKEEKHFLGIGQAQLRNPNSVEKQPSQMVAAYSVLLLSGILLMQKEGWETMVEKTKWYKTQKRPSCRDLSRFLMEELKSAA
jgi:hypothetical protein